ncbi:GntR family transcriptional regulator [Nonomuraea sp. PA05]|uniref:GntR family transcriptional regulator n=1 Tax=Nonomuraea sp. PA05 TaxID=2604466 RepID=UPI001652B03B|nr:GntR family transcriptional regulator [Nonomuraea sp. PA05]
MTINPRSYVPVYQQLADILRNQIRSGDLAPGTDLPGEFKLAEQYAVGREAARKALAVLRSEGLVATRRGEGSYVRTPRERQRIELGAADKVTIRMPTPAERVELDIDEGVALVVLARRGTEEKLLPSDEVVITGKREAQKG